MIDTITIKPFDETHIEGILELFKEVFGGDVNKEWFHWKYLSSPWGSVGYVAKNSNKVVAYYGGIRFKFLYKGTTLWGYQLCDVMTKANYRGVLFSKTPIVAALGEMLYRENSMDFAFGFPSLRHARLQAVRLGGQGYRLIRLFYKTINPLSARSVLSVREGWEGLELRGVQRLITSNSLVGPLAMVKDIDYLKWRYCQHPLQTYSFLVFKGLFRHIGLIVYTIKGGMINIVESFLRDPMDCVKVFTTAESYLHHRHPDIDKIALWCHPDSAMSTCLTSLGFQSEDHIPIAVNPKSLGDAEVFYKGFFYSMGDYDAA